VADKFFDEQAEQSQIKADIVSKYFWSWAKVIIGTQKRHPHRSERRVGYIDLFAGPGRYRDGALSTPVMIIEGAIRDPDLCERLVAIFNDNNADNSRSLEECLAALPGIKKLREQPTVYTGEVGENIVARFESMALIPSFLFVDPFGYKGLSLRLVNSVLRNWGCDCVFFFNYNRISMGLGNEFVEQHMDALFGKARADQLRERFRMQAVEPWAREAFIVEEMMQALKEMGGQFVLPFRFRNERGTRTTHHLFFVTKHFRGYSIMKDIMAGCSSASEQGVATFEYNPADERQPALFELIRPLDDLEEMLLKDYAGRTLGIRDIFEAHSVGRRYVLKNYRDVLCKLEQEKRVSIYPPCPPRRKGTLAEHAKIAFKPK
jgi:three-Cys-motif partner protein